MKVIDIQKTWVDKPIDFSNTTITCTTIILDFRACPSPKSRVTPLLHCIFAPYNLHRNLSKEYRLWVEQRLADTMKHKLRWMLDHYLLWLVYCFMVLFTGYVEGGKWEIPPERR